MQFQKMKVSMRLAMAFSVVLVTMVATTLITLKQVAGIEANMAQMVLRDGVKVKLSNDMADAIHIVARVMRSVILLSEPAERDAEMAKIAKARASYDTAWTALQKIPANEAGQALRQRIAQAQEAARPLNNKVIELALANQDADATAFLMTQANAPTNHWQDILEEHIKLQESNTQHAFEAAEADYSQARLTLLLSNAFCIVLAICSAWLVTRSITRQLGAEPGDAVQLAQGVAAGNLAMHVELKAGDTLSMMAQLKNMQQSLVAVVERVREGSESVSTASAEIAQGNQDLSSRTESQASALEETAASMEELSSTVKQNADSARQANQLALSASTTAIQGGEVVNQVVDTMKHINDSSNRIADIISVIDGIAFQTNILALNAAVEAARAGEQGRGFAVVAGEVRNLAQRSAGAAKEIKELIHDSAIKTAEGTKQVEAAGETMQEIVSSVKRVSDIIGEIAAASTEQSAGIAQINDAIIKMDDVTQQNTALVEEAAAAAESMMDQAEELMNAVSVFSIEDVQTHSRSRMLLLK
ncbi:MAG: methyl-accepting chemotaxis protein [Methylotenera sp.]|nr:methyl-accepting chemotaxis protein [Methylotenera sp.]